MKIKSIALLLFMFVTALSSQAQNPLQGLRAGDIAPSFTLNNQNGESVSLDKLLEKGPVVLTWYRGGWCPYCNLALKSLSDELPAIKALGGTLVALSPELPDKAIITDQENCLEFEVLSDLNNDVARKYGLTFKLSPELADRYEKGFGLSKYNGNTDAELPIPATYIIDRDKTIKYAYVNTDYKQRANPTKIIDELTKLKAETNKDKLVMIWSSDDPMVAKRIALMYSHSAKRNKWFKEVTLLIWGPSAKLIATDKELQQKIAAMKKDGVIIKACIACTQEYGVTEELKALEYDVMPMGIPLTNYLKEGYHVLTF
jgi:peroxiredoxin